jgi:hypothetical protein
MPLCALVRGATPYPVSGPARLPPRWAWAVPVLVVRFLLVICPKANGPLVHRQKAVLPCLLFVPGAYSSSAPMARATASG